MLNSRNSLRVLGKKPMTALPADALANCSKNIRTSCHSQLQKSKRKRSLSTRAGSEAATAPVVASGLMVGLETEGEAVIGTGGVAGTDVAVETAVEIESAAGPGRALARARPHASTPEGPQTRKLAKINRNRKRRFVALLQELQLTMADIRTMSATDEERGLAKINAKELLAKIPSDKGALFEATIRWDLLDSKLLDRLRPWVKKQLLELLGEEEQQFVDFVIGVLKKKSTAHHLVNDLRPVLDSETEDFVVRLWRMLIFELTRREQAFGL
eukprot:TRINITY_DN333_c1_g1_i4.p2 TRINITY_DN333_c1_g1~~TRINITY_DN333_c1_g1_i4.p2  ORF type:complete len:271 (-),score=28.89 TRINITY_DN333_c1_g1_i4:111-923(-)